MRNLIAALVAIFCLAGCGKDETTSPPTVREIGLANAATAWRHVEAAGKIEDIKKGGFPAFWRYVTFDAKDLTPIPGLGEKELKDRRLQGEAQRGVADFWVSNAAMRDLDDSETAYLKGYHEGFAAGETKGSLPEDSRAVISAAEGWANEQEGGFDINMMGGYRKGLETWVRPEGGYVNPVFGIYSAAAFREEYRQHVRELLNK